MKTNYRNKKVRVEGVEEFFNGGMEGNGIRGLNNPYFIIYKLRDPNLCGVKS